METMSKWFWWLMCLLFGWGCPLDSEDDMADGLPMPNSGMSREEQLRQQYEEMQARLEAQRLVEQQEREAEVRALLESGSDLVREQLAAGAGFEDGFPPDLEDEELVRTLAENLDLDTLRVLGVVASHDIDVDVQLAETTETRPVPYVADERRPDKMTSYSQIGRVMPSEYVYPKRLFWYRYAMKQSRVWQDFEIVREIDVAEIVIDGSGSMKYSISDDLDRHQLARGVALKLLERAMNRGGKYLLRTFNVKPGRLWRAANAKEAEVVATWLREGGSSFYNGGTNILNAVACACEDIQKSREETGLFGNGSVILITDGEDEDVTVAKLKKILGDIVLHVITIGKDNFVLKEFAESHGGTYQRF